MTALARLLAWAFAKALAMALATVLAMALEQGIIALGTHRLTIKAIHTQVVSKTIDRFSNNRFLHQRPPLVHPIETQFSRQTKCILRQLRSGFCAKLRDYQVLRGRPGDDLCPDC